MFNKKKQHNTELENDNQLTIDRPMRTFFRRKGKKIIKMSKCYRNAKKTHHRRHFRHHVTYLHKSEPYIHFSYL